MSGIANLAGMGAKGVEPRLVLAQLLASRGWTKERLAHESGLSTKTISRILKGETREPDPRTRHALAGALEVDEAVFAPPRPSYAPQTPTQAGFERVEAQLRDLDEKLDELLNRLPAATSAVAGGDRARPSAALQKLADHASTRAEEVRSRTPQAKRAPRDSGR